MKKVLYIILFISVTSSAFAQRSFNTWSYSMGFGTGDLHEYIGPVSFRGATYNYTKIVTGNVGVGVEIGWNTFYEEKDFDTYSQGKFDYSGKQWRYSNHVPLLFTMNYYLTPDDDMIPFVGLGIGTIYAERRTDMGQWAFTRDAWEFALKPEVGVIFDTGGAGVSLSGKYYYGFKAGDLPAQGYFTINIGFAFIN
jgi:outer membrane protein